MKNQKSETSRVLAWYREAIPAVAVEAHRRMMRGDYSGEPLYFYYKPNGLSVVVASETDGHPEGYHLVTAERAPGNLERDQLVRWLLARTGRLELFPTEGKGLSGGVYDQGYTHFTILNTADGPLIESGWHSAGEAENRTRQLMAGRAVTRAKAIELGFDPSVNRNWKHKALSGLDGVSKGTRKGLSGDVTRVGAVPPTCIVCRSVLEVRSIRRWNKPGIEVSCDCATVAASNLRDAVSLHAEHALANNAGTEGLSEYEGEMKRLSFGVMPLKTEFVTRTKGQYPYPMELVGADREVVQDLLDDERIEEFDSEYREGIEEFDSEYRHKLGVRVLNAKAMYHFLTKLKESEEEGNDAAGDLASAILGTLGYEWI
jgi:hypothetical protein